MCIEAIPFSSVLKCKTSRLQADCLPQLKVEDYRAEVLYSRGDTHGGVRSVLDRHRIV